MNELSLFSGYGGFTLGLKLAGLDTRTVGYVEIDKYCQQLIQARIADGFLDDAPIWPDIRAFDGQQCRGVVDIITAGFPCQPHSVAGQRRGEADERNLWPDTLRVVRDVGPSYVLLENVPGILVDPGYAGTVVGELAEAGYDCLWGCVPAATVGAPHLRWRWWCLGWNSNSIGHAWEFAAKRSVQKRADSNTHGNGKVPYAPDNGCPGRGRTTEQERQHEAVGRGEQPRPDGKAGDMADAYSNSEPENGIAEPWQECRWWAVEPDVGRVANGVAHRVDRLRALGNGIVPAVVAEFLRGG